VEVVTEAIREVRPRSIVARDGRVHGADVLIFGTGFQAQDPIPKGMGIGPGGVDLHAHGPRGPEADRGVAVAGIPNLFLMVGPNSGLAHNSMVYMIEAQARYIVDALRVMRSRNCNEVMVRTDAQAQFNDDLRQQSNKTVWQAGCTSWYINEQGQNTLLWPDFSFRYARGIRQFDPVAYQFDGVAADNGTIEQRPGE